MTLPDDLDKDEFFTSMTALVSGAAQGNMLFTKLFNAITLFHGIVSYKHVHIL